MVALYDYQSRAIVSLREAVREGHRSIILQLPTGGGKTIVAAEMVKTTLAKGRRCLFVAHRLELIEQPYRKLLDAGLDELDVGIRVGGKKRNLDAPIQLASIDSLEEHDFAGFDLIIIDEAHRSCCRTYLRALEHKDPDAFVIGLTATPERLDGKGLKIAGFTKIVVAAQPSELIALGRITDPEVWTVPDNLLPDVSGVGVVGGDFNPKQLAEAVDRVELIGSIVDHYAQHGLGLPAVAFATSIQHSQSIVASFEAAGIRARHVDGSSGAKARRAALADIRAGTLQIVSQCNLWIEGMDEPALRVGIMARPTGSLTIHLQSCGRVMRANGQPSVILDHAGNVMRHGLPSEDREYSLEGRVARASRSAACRRCSDCFLIVAAGKLVCPGCGIVFPMHEPPAVLYTPQQLRLLDPAGYRRYCWDRLWLEAYAEGQRPGWVHKRYADRFKQNPGAWPLPPRPPIDRSSAARKAKERELYLIARVHGKNSAWIEDKMRRIFDES